MIIFCTGNINKDNFNSIVLDIIKINNSYENTIYFDNKLNNTKLDKNIHDNYCSIIDFDFDLVICIGGDGAFLSIVREMDKKQIPIIGIHIGNLGFLNQANKNNFVEILNDIFSRFPSVEYSEYHLIEAKVYNNSSLNEGTKLIALNDIVIKHADLLRLIKLDINLNKKFLNSYACDGIIFSSPIGSTAYSLSAGGPIVLHDINSLIITPISPHSLSARPIIIDDQKIIQVSFPDHNDKINIVSDGQVQKVVDSSSIVEIKKSKLKAKFVISDLMESYFSKLKNKIGFSVPNSKK